MAPRRRSDKKKGWPAHLYERGDGYYSWRHPKTGVEYGLGRDRLKAFDEAIKANIHVKISAQPVSLVQQIQGVGNLWDAWIDAYEKILAKRKFAPKTRIVYAGYCRRARAIADPGATFGSVTTQVLAKAFADLKDEGKERTAQQFRSFMKDCFNTACQEGWGTTNPILVTRTIGVEIKRARLMLEVFQKVYERETLAWAKNAYALALLSAQPLESCQSGQFREIREDCWWTQRGKTKALICIPLAIRLDCIGLSLADVVKQCRSTGVLSRHLIHQTAPSGNSKVGAKLATATISKRFTRTLSEIGMDWGDKSAPTFHEIRSLSERLHKAQGDVNTQELLGHKSAKTTEMYHDSRGAEWVRVSVRGTV